MQDGDVGLGFQQGHAQQLVLLCGRAQSFTDADVVRAGNRKQTQTSCLGEVTDLSVQLDHVFMCASEFHVFLALEEDNHYHHYTLMTMEGYSFVYLFVLICYLTYWKIVKVTLLSEHKSEKKTFHLLI